MYIFFDNQLVKNSRMQLMFKPSQAGNSGNSGPSLKPFKDLFIIYNLFIFYNITDTEKFHLLYIFFIHPSFILIH
jgi:hypothetical protein